jgi:uncharacterized protein (DUF305 family)
MKKFISLAAIIGALSVTSPAFSQDSNNAQTYDNQSPLNPTTSPDADKASYDLQFIDTLIAHHELEIALVKIAQEKSQNKDVRTKAKALSANYKAEIVKLKKARLDVTKDAAQAINLYLDGMKLIDFDEIKSKSPKDFDEEFLSVIIKQEEGGKELVESALKKAKNRSVKLIATEISKNQTLRISSLEELLKKVKD